jgi:hypothetical protein
MRFGDFIVAHVRLSAETLLPWGRCHLCGRASAVLCSLVNRCPSVCDVVAYLAPLPMMLYGCGQSTEW